MRKGFTLIEVLVVSVMSMIFFNFLFTLFFNTLSEIRYFDAKENLAQNSFRFIEVLTKGIKNDSEYISGVVSLKSLDSSTAYTAQDDSKSIFDANSNYKIKKSDGTNIVSQYEFKKIDTDDNLTIENRSGLYNITFNAISKNIESTSSIGDAEYVPYNRLVFVR
jgi:type II secretory pathway pseudopilin PulG